MEWWKRTHSTRHPRINRDTRIYINGDYRPLPKNSFVSPVRKSYLPYGHWAAVHYDETKDMVVDSPVGFGMIDLEDVDW